MSRPKPDRPDAGDPVDTNTDDNPGVVDNRNAAGERLAAQKERAILRTVRRERAVLCGAYLKGQLDANETPLQELALLLDTAGAQEVGRLRQNIKKISVKYYIGKGKAGELKDLVEETEADVVVFDNDLSPSQSQNLEKLVGARILDRTELILDIFASRAITHLAKIQVALAMNQYRLPRLKRLWSHLERQRGGLGLRSGPGEKQIESDRRVIRKRIRDYQKELKNAATHKQMLSGNRSEEHFLVSLIGYTNAGKTTLLNALTGARLYADNRLFATLDTRSRLYKMKNGKSVIVSDTVGFIQRLPHHLVASFQATLQESLHADLLLHVIDTASLLMRKQIDTVETVIEELGAGAKSQLVVFNKIDAVEDPSLIETLRREYPGAVFVSALKRYGFDELENAILEYYQHGAKSVKLAVRAADGRALAYISQHGFDENREYKNETVIVDVRMDQGHLNHLFKISRNVTILEPQPAEKGKW